MIQPINQQHTHTGTCFTEYKSTICLSLLYCPGARFCLCLSPGADKLVFMTLCKRGRR